MPFEFFPSFHVLFLCPEKYKAKTPGTMSVVAWGLKINVLNLLCKRYFKGEDISIHYLENYVR